MSGHETKGKIEEGAAPFEGDKQHGWAPDVPKTGAEDDQGHEASEKSFEGAPEGSSSAAGDQGR
jgi:hypothetical protein